MIETLKARCNTLLDLYLPERRAMALLRAQWGRPGSKEQPFAARWFALLRGARAHVDDKTWDDLEFPRIFAVLDTTVTPIGSQALYRQLREYLDEPVALAARHALHQRLRDEPRLRERLQRQLLPLEEPAFAHVADVLHAESLEAPTHRVALSLWGAAMLAWLVVVALCGWSPWCWLVLVPVNLVVLYRHAGRRHRELLALNGCLRVMRVADRLASAPELPQQLALRSERAARDAVRRKLLLAQTFNWVPDFLTLLLNFGFLFELVIYLWSVERFLRVRHRLHASFALVGELDAALAGASGLAMYPQHCVPVLTDAVQLEIKQGRHPLLPDGVANTLCLAQRSALVTGSNMAGKTTFVKMLATNLILGRTLGFCLAQRAVLPRLPVMAAVQGVHSVESGKSHYFAQIEAIAGFLDCAARRRGGLFVLDEPFSGTNTVERIAIACAVLRALGQDSLVLFTSHDVELQALLGERYGLYHFQEDPEVDGYFDYRLRAGAARQRNAIRMLARMGFPDPIIDEAMRRAADSGHAPA